jgi:hypothetical protein
MRIALVLALATICGGAWGAETVPAEPPASPATAAATKSITDLRAALPDAPSLIERDGVLYWDDGKGSAYRVADADEKGATLDTEIGAIAVPRRMLADNRTDCLGALPKLVVNAQGAKLKDVPGLTLAEGVMTGVHLRCADLLVIAEGVLRKGVAPAADRGPDRKVLEDATAALRKDLEQSRFDQLGRKTVEDILRRIPLTDDAEKFELDEVLPSFARRVARSGWLAQTFPGDASAAKLVAAIVAAEKMQPITLFEGQGLRLAEVRNALGQGGWVLTTPARTSYTRPHPTPMYLGDAKSLGLTLVADLPSGANPMDDADKAVSARLFQGSRAIASWSRKDGLQCDPAEWRRALPDHGPRVDDNAVAGFLPPHIAIADLDGDLRLLVTGDGVLTPPRDGSAAEGERFLADAAKVLPDAPHLDLVGEHIFYYVYDSPDSRFPTLIGNKAVKGDIHQTALQTLATTTGGMCRGDCDDLSELYQAIAERQGRTAHVISLPQHAALAYAEKRDDGWHTFVLQTGQPLEFTDAKLPEALRKTYLHFDESDNFDPNGLGLLLRFSGENTRGPWRLSWRIFAEPEYAKTMIDVQKDWHFSTYQRGIRKVQKLIADGDTDTANYRELSGLYEFTGQYALAVQFHEKALAATEDPESRLYASAELIMHQFSADQDEAARATATKLLDDDLPKAQKMLGQRVMQLGFQLAGYLNHGKAFDLTERVLKETMLDEMVRQIDQVGQFIASPQFNKRRWESAEQLRRILQMYAGTAIALIDGVGPDGIAGDETLQKVVKSAQDWLNHIAFHDISDDSDIVARYAAAGAFYAAVLGEDRLLAMLDGVEPPKDNTRKHAERVGGLAQVNLDLPWIRASLPFWYGRLRESFDREKDSLDKAKTLLYGKRAAEAYAAQEKLGIEDPFLDTQAHLAAVITALVGEDEKVLRERLRFVKEKDDKRLRDDTAEVLGDCARFLSQEWYAKVLQCWVEECDYKPKYFWIAWRAALNKAPAHALMVGKLAAERFKDDPAFAEEYQFMVQLLGSDAAKAAEPHPAPDKTEKKKKKEKAAK